MTVKLSPIGNGFQFFTTTGIPLDGGLLYTYAAGTTTPLATYTTDAGNVANTNPIVLGTDGRPPQEIWLTEGYNYKLVLADSGNNVIQTYDDIYGIPSTSGAGGTTLPPGMIMLWYGAVGLIPAGWALCDGTNSTPDLRDKFIVGAGLSYTVGLTGGSATSVLPQHNHTASVVLNEMDPGHAHNFEADSGTAGTGTFFQATGASLDTIHAVVSSDSIVVNTTGMTFDPTVTVDDAGVSPAGGNLPPYYALCYIMKV